MSQDAVEKKLDEAALNVAAALKARNQKVVFAESCTGGKMAAAMTTVPGISGYFCGSAVTYREATKSEWLSISQSEIAEHAAESEHTTVAMAKRVLHKTPEADVAIAITGHLGPGVSDEIDGLIYVVVAERKSTNPNVHSTHHRLSGLNRRERQTEAATRALEAFLKSV